MKFYLLLAVFTWSISSFAAPLSGIYTIGGTNPDYATFSLAAAALNSQGVNGPVTFNVRPGTYNESVTINNITGATATNHITFQSENGDQNSVIISNPSNTVVLNASRYVTFRDMTINATTKVKNTNKTFVFQNGCNTDSIINCVLTAPIAPWDDYTFVIHASTGTNDNIVVMNSQITGAGFGYEVEGGGTNFGPYLYNNAWTDQTYMAINLMDCRNVIVQGNCIKSTCVTTPQYSGATIGSRFGIILWNGCRNVQILGNKINGVMQQGLYIPTIGGTNFLIANNFIEAYTGVYGLYTKFYTFLHNSFRTTSHCISLGHASTDNVFKNNIFYSSGGAPIFQIDSVNRVLASDYNDFYSTGGVSNLFSTLAAWRAGTGFDANSINILPPYTSTGDFHLTDHTGFLVGQPQNNITVDIDENVRSTVSPAIGADDVGPIDTTCCSCANPVTRLIARFNANPLAVCANDTVTFTDASTGGPNAWRWTFNGGTPNSSSSQNPQVVYNSPGTYDVKLVVTSGSGSDSLTKSGYITINPLPDAGSIAANPVSVCYGDSSLLNVTGTTGTVQWQSSDNGASYSDIPGSGSSNYQTGGLTQSAFYRVKANNSCGVDSSVAVSVAVVPLPVALISAPDTLFCSGDSVQVCATGGHSYIWNTGDTSACTYIENAGGYWVTATGDSGCTSASNRIEMDIHPLPSVSIVVQGDTLSSFGAVAYQWYLNGTLINGATNPIYVADQSGNYSLGITDANGCSARSTEVSVVINGMDQLQSSSLSIYPNPFHDYFVIQVNQMNRVEITDMLGRTVPHQETRDVSGLGIRIQPSGWTYGMYYVKVFTYSGEVVVKMVHQ